MVAPLAVEYKPAVQAVQDPPAGRPVPVKYVPAEQSWQVLARLAARLDEYFPAVQAVQTVSPAVSPYVPAPQTWQLAAAVNPLPVA